MQKGVYNKHFFHHLQADSLRSAKVIVPLVLQYLKPRSVLDIGCGTGAFLSVFKEQGSIILGVDGAWVSKEERSIPDDAFQSADLERPLHLNKQFDLVVSLEVAEHISKASAKNFVENCTRHGDLVLFSAAIPHQGGTHHINEQWPSYWVALFAEQGYVPVDCLRKKIWNNPEVSFWFAQNILFFVKKEKLPQYPVLQKECAENGDIILPLIHPVLFEAKAKKAERLDKLTSLIPYGVKSAILKVIRR
ncbi:MAG TPA: class I SAM-dependent methyltransferase [Candidatus Paceibacterota bacterium]